MMKIFRRLWGATFLALIAIVAVGSPSSAATWTESLDPDLCVTVVFDQTTPGSGWSISASGPVLATYSDPFVQFRYPLTVGPEHSGFTSDDPVVYLSACNICPVGTVSVTFATNGRVTPPAVLGGPNPIYFSSSEVPNLGEYQSQCGSASLDGIFRLPETLRPILAPAVIVGSGAAIAAMVLPIARSTGTSAIGSPGGSPGGLIGAIGGTGAPPHGAWPSPGVAGPEPSPIQGGGLSIGGQGVHVGPIDVPPPPNPPIGPDDRTLVTCWRDGGRCWPGPWTSPSGEQQWRWYCEHHHFPWGSDYVQEYRLWRASRP